MFHPSPHAATRLCTAAYARVLCQAKRGFDGLRPGALGLSLIKDGEDARARGSCSLWV
jgi:hypothetical protein